MRGGHAFGDGFEFVGGGILAGCERVDEGLAAR
jgi:hypothetical protein